VPDNPDPASQPTPNGDVPEPADADSLPNWFTQFLNDRQTRKPSAHTMKAYRQDFVAIATLVAGGDPSRLAVADITKDSMRTALAAYARDHEAASIRRCWSTWNVLCTFLYTGEQLAANPMQLVGRPKLAKPLPKALPRTAVEALLETVAQDQDSHRQTDWAERDLAIILTALLAGLRAEELRQADIGDIRTTDDGAAVIHVKGKGGKERSVPIEAELLSVIEAYLDSRATRFPGAKAHSGCCGLGSIAMALAVPVIRWPRQRTHHPGNIAITHQAGLQTRRPRCPTRARSLGARSASHLRHRTRRLRSQRLHPDEAARPRIDDDVAALRHRCGHRNPKCRGAEPVVRANSRQDRI
jgi:site-specific recombinase XerC